MGFLARHCRVCCKGSGRHYYKCCQYVPLMECLGVDLSGDEAEIHPESFCNSCYLTAKRLLSRSDANSLHSPAQWYPHNETICDVCDVKCKGGRPKKSSKAGRPSYVSLYIKSVALKVPSFTLSQVLDERYREEVTCGYCRTAINCPVEILPCKSLLCCSCTLSLATSSFNCPTCSCLYESCESTFTKPSSIVEKMINSLTVKCGECGVDVKVESLGDECRSHMRNKTEVATKFITEMIHQSELSDQTITIPTGGRVSQ